jgi:hypothetical protein
LNKLNKKTIQAGRVIEWAFLCSSVSYNNDGGLDVQNLTIDFNHSSFRSLVVVFRISFKRSVADDNFMVGNRVYSRLDEWLFQLVVKDYAGTQLYAYQSKFEYVDKTAAVTFDPVPAMEPGHYRIEIMADGFLEHTLDLIIK